MHPDRPAVILASGSPRRRELLARIGFPFLVQPIPVPEEEIESQFTGAAEDLGLHLAQEKSLAAVAAIGGEIPIVTADTTVVLDGASLGKPRDAAEAETMLHRLRGRTHRVITGVVVALPAAGTRFAGSRTTPVTMRDYSDDEIHTYIATGDPFDKAGSYAVQHPAFAPVARMGGCATNVIGLPLCLLTRLLGQAGIAAPSPTESAGPCPWDARCATAPE
jgi:septum formation protein